MMPKHISSYPSNRRYDWKEPGKLSFAEFNLLVRQHVAEIMESQEHIGRACHLFRSKGDISSDEADYLLVSLHTIIASICSFYRTFEAPMSLPAVVRPLYYPFVANLLASEKLIKRTVQIVRTFNSSGHRISTAVVKQHYKIVRNLEELLEACEEIKLTSQSMLDQARFQLFRQA